MRWLVTFLRRSSKISCPAEAGRSKVEEPASDAKDPQDDRAPFLNLPAELLLLIAEFLDKEFQVLLSLTCRRMRVLLTSNVDLSLCDAAVKLRFLTRLEIDHPEYLTCRACCCMFKWPGTRYGGYRCPRAYRHSFTDNATSYEWRMGGNRNIGVSREVLDLIFRAYDRGQQYGLPLSYLSSKGTDYDGITRKNEARFVDGELLLASHWEVDSKPGEPMAEKARYFNLAFCIHGVVNVYREKIWQFVERVVAGMTGSEVFRTLKCPFCATDYTLHMQKSPSGQLRIVLKVWRNYGRRYEKTLASEQLFHRKPSSRLDADLLSRRDLKALFECYRSPTDNLGYI